MKSYIDNIIVTDPNGEESILYPNTKQEAVEGLQERLSNIEIPDITTTTDTTLEGSYSGLLKIDEIGGVTEQGDNPSVDNPQDIKPSVINGIKVHGENFLNLSEIIVPTKPDIADNGYIISLTGKSAWYQTAFRIDKVKEGQIVYVSTEAIKNTLTNKGFIAIQQRNSDKAVIGTKYLDESTLSTDFTVLKDTVEVIVIVASNASGTDLDSDNTITVTGLMVSLVKDSKWKPYQSHEVALSEPITLYGNDTARDILTTKQIRRKYKEVVFDGSGYTVDVKEFSGSKRFCISSILKGKIIETSGAFLNLACTHFVVDAAILAENNIDNVCCGYSKDEHLYVRADQFASVTEFNTFFAQNPMTVVYELAEEEVTDLPLTDQIALQSIPTYDGTTYIEWDCEIPPTFRGEYGTSKVGGYTLEARQTAIVNGIKQEMANERIAALEATLVNNI